MSIIVGHTASRRKRSFPTLLLFILALIFLSGWYLLSAEQQVSSPKATVVKPTVPVTTTTVKVEIKEEEPKPVVNSSVVKVLTHKTCKAMDGLTPREISSSFYSDEAVYYYTEVSLPVVPGTIKHVWLDPRGQEYANVPLNISRQPAATYSYITPQATNKGKWRVQLVVGDKIIAEQSFEVL